MTVDSTGPVLDDSLKLIAAKSENARSLAVDDASCSLPINDLSTFAFADFSILRDGMPLVCLCAQMQRAKVQLGSNLQPDVVVQARGKRGNGEDSSRRMACIPWARGVHMPRDSSSADPLKTDRKPK